MKGLTVKEEHIHAWLSPLHRRTGNNICSTSTSHINSNLVKKYAKSYTKWQENRKRKVLVHVCVIAEIKFCSIAKYLRLKSDQKHCRYLLV